MFSLDRSMYDICVAWLKQRVAAFIPDLEHQELVTF
jgi:hypothetical protein